MKTILAILFALATPLALAQTTKQSATVNITVTAPPPSVQLTANTASVQAGQAASVTATVIQAGAPATGSVDLCAEAPGTSSYVFVQSFPLVNGSVTCGYPIPASALIGAYSVQVQYPSNGSCK